MDRTIIDLSMALMRGKHLPEDVLERIRLDNCAVLRRIAFEGDVPTLRWLHAEGLNHYDFSIKFGEIFNSACERGDIDVVRFLVDEVGFTSADVEALDFKALRIVAENKQTEILKFLLSRDLISKKIIF